MKIKVRYNGEVIKEDEMTKKELTYYKKVLNKSLPRAVIEVIKAKKKKVDKAV